MTRDSAGPTLAVWVYGTGRSRAQVAAAVASARQQSTEVVVIDAATDLTELLAGTRADFIAWLDASSTLLPGALETVRRVIPRAPGDLYYGDSVGSPSLNDVAVLRPVQSPLRLLNHDYPGALRIVRTAAVRDAGGFDGAAGADIYDLTLRLSTRGSLVHLPFELSRGGDGEGDDTATLDAARRHLARVGSTAQVAQDAPGVRRVSYPVAGSPLVSVIIPTRGTSASIGGSTSVLVVDAVSGILERSSYPELEIVIVADDVTPQSVIDSLVAFGDRVRLVRWSAAFNFSAKVNRGAAFARGEFLVVLNDDVQLITPDWIETMLGLLQRPGVGLVGTALLFEDGTVQHGGHLYKDASAGHIAFHWPADRDDPLHSLFVDREVSGVTAACAMISAALFSKVGGFSDLLPGNYNDVDFCLKVRSTGASVMWTPHARLYHYESKTRVPRVSPAELGTLRRRWQRRLLVDSYWPY